jgi:hypothetical protein
MGRTVFQENHILKELGQDGTSFFLIPVTGLDRPEPEKRKTKSI